MLEEGYIFNTKVYNRIFKIILFFQWNITYWYTNIYFIGSPGRNSNINNSNSANSETFENVTDEELLDKIFQLRDKLSTLEVRLKNKKNIKSLNIV